MNKFLQFKNCFEWRKNIILNEIRQSEKFLNELSKIFKNEKIFQSEQLQKICKSQINSQEIFSKIQNIQESLAFNDKMLLSLFGGKKSDFKSNLLRFISEVHIKFC